MNEKCIIYCGPDYPNGKNYQCTFTIDNTGSIEVQWKAGIYVIDILSKKGKLVSLTGIMSEDGNSITFDREYGFTGNITWERQKLGRSNHRFVLACFTTKILMFGII